MQHMSSLSRTLLTSRPIGNPPSKHDDTRIEDLESARSGLQKDLPAPSDRIRGARYTLKGRPTQYGAAYGPFLRLD